MRQNVWLNRARSPRPAEADRKPVGRSRFFLVVEGRPLETDQGHVSLVIGTVCTSAELPGQITPQIFRMTDS